MNIPISEAETLDLNKVSLKEKISYGIGSLGNNLIYALMASYLMFFYTEAWGLSPIAIGSLFFIARLWDGFNDPIMGLLVDNTETRWGKFRPYLLFVPFIMAPLTVACFWGPDLSPTAKILWAFVTYILWSMSFTAMDIPYWSMSAAITQDTKERTTIVMIPRTLATFGFFIILTATLPMVNILSFGGSKITGWRTFAIIIGICAIIMTLITFKNVKERVHVKNKEPQTIRGILKLLKSNKPLQALMISMLLFETNFAIRGIFPAYYLKYNYNAPHLIPLFGGLYMLIAVMGSILSPLITNRFGKRNVAIWGSMTICITSLALYFFSYPNLYALIGLSLFGALADGASGIAKMSMLVDTVEYGQWKTGERREGAVFSTNIFKTKLASAIGGGAGAIILGFIGFIPKQTPSTFTMKGIHMIYTLIPGIIGFLTVIPLYFYSLTEDKFSEIVHELKERNAQ